MHDPVVHRIKLGPHQIHFGADALRYAIVAIQCFAFWGAWHYYLAGRHYREELEISQGKVLA